MSTRDWNLGDVRRVVARLRAGDTVEQVAADAPSPRSSPRPPPPFDLHNKGPE